MINEMYGTAPLELPLNEFNTSSKEDKLEEAYEKWEQENMKRIQRPKSLKHRNKKKEENQFRDELGVFEKYVSIEDHIDKSKDDKVSQILKKIP